MSQNGTVNVTLPNGQTVALQSIKALYAAMEGKLDKNQWELQKIQGAIAIENTLSCINELSCFAGETKLNIKTIGGNPHIVYKWDDSKWYFMTFPRGSGEALSLGANCWSDNTGYIRKSSPIIQISPDGTFTTNDESEGATVTKLGTGHYQIANVLGYNADGAWCAWWYLLAEEQQRTGTHLH
ncbi:hypothetical protein FE394_19265 [Xenorhabdus sp. Reich]|uniref:Phage tail protein C-terminal domain-containing protein n=2 Tax=Xenorhabdus littoralis TaxID=2582835 RepID=A0ABU4SRQ6_9GAMM|nr:hypothetical protein [Xenorhabdus sp. Reich]